MTIHVYNTLLREKQVFTPIDAKNVRMYVCGPTVYDYAHIGNARPVVAFDVLFRLLRHTYGADHVTYARNITDIDDKIMDESLRTGETIESITKRTAGWYHQDMGALNALSPSKEPCATDFVPQMVKLIAQLIEKGFAYVAENHVLFNVPAMTDYGQLSKRGLDDMIAGARVDVAPYKKSPADFVLWKPSIAGQPGWDSPWGRGRPGWHIECSAMAGELLGEVFDIHAGGIDLIFPHHENEIAQSRCAHGTPLMAQYWMHNGFVQVNGQKMSKSLGNFFTVHELLEEGHHGEAIRLALLSAHYRQPTDITREGLTEAKFVLDRYYSALAKVKNIEVMPQVTDHVLAAIADDLNTPLAISEFHELLSRLNKADSDSAKSIAKAALLGAADLLGLLQVPLSDWRYSLPPGRGQSQSLPSKQQNYQYGVTGTPNPPLPLLVAEIESQIEARAAARKAKNFAEADRIRNDLAARGFIPEDNPDGTTTWKRT